MKPIDGDAMVARVEALWKNGAVDMNYFHIVREAVQMEPEIDVEPRCCRTCGWWMAVEEGGLCMDDLTVKYPNDEACRRWKRGEEAGR